MSDRRLHPPAGHVPEELEWRLVSALGLGGYHLALATSEREGIRIVHAAIGAGVTFMDNAWVITAEETTAKHGGPVGRKQHGFPDDDDVCA